jgi:hypothetical protein
MALSNRSEVIKKIIDGLRLHPGSEDIPTSVANTIVPVFISNEDEYSYIAESATDTSAGTTAIYTIPAGYEFYLTGAHISGQLGVEAEEVTSTITGVIGGATKIILRGQGKTSNIANTFGHFNTTLNLAYPLKLDEGTAISHVITESVGVLNATAGIIGYIKQKK